MAAKSIKMSLLKSMLCKFLLTYFPHEHPSDAKLLSALYLKVERLLVVEDVAFAVVSGRGPRGLVPERRAPFDGQGLVCVDKGLAD